VPVPSGGWSLKFAAASAARTAEPEFAAAVASTALLHQALGEAWQQWMQLLLPALPTELFIPLVARLRPDPSQPPEPTRILEGVLGDSDRPGFRRLYVTPEAWDQPGSVTRVDEIEHWSLEMDQPNANCE
jgi:hypothetical protein